MNNNFTKIYNTEPSWLLSLNTSELSLVLYMADEAVYEKELGGYAILMNGYQKKKMAKLLSLSNCNSVANILTGLVRKQVIYRVDRGTYLLNPNLLTVGDSRTCEKAKVYFPGIEDWLNNHIQNDISII